MVTSSSFPAVSSAINFNINVKEPQINPIELEGNHFTFNGVSGLSGGRRNRRDAFNDDLFGKSSNNDADFAAFGSVGDAGASRRSGRLFYAGADDLAPQKRPGKYLFDDGFADTDDFSSSNYFAQSLSLQAGSKPKPILPAALGNAQDQLANSYLDAVKARDAAEKARQNYMDLAGQLDDFAVNNLGQGLAGVSTNTASVSTPMIEINNTPFSSAQNFNAPTSLSQITLPDVNSFPFAPAPSATAPSANGVTLPSLASNKTNNTNSAVAGPAAGNAQSVFFPFESMMAEWPFSPGTVVDNNNTAQSKTDTTPVVSNPALSKKPDASASSVGASSLPFLPLPQDNVVIAPPVSQPLSAPASQSSADVSNPLLPLSQPNQDQSKPVQDKSTLSKASKSSPADTLAVTPDVTPWEQAGVSKPQSQPNTDSSVYTLPAVQPEKAFGPASANAANKTETPQPKPDVAKASVASKPNDSVVIPAPAPFTLAEQPQPDPNNVLFPAEFQNLPVAQNTQPQLPQGNVSGALVSPQQPALPTDLSQPQQLPAEWLAQQQLLNPLPTTAAPQQSMMPPQQGPMLPPELLAQQQALPPGLFQQPGLPAQPQPLPQQPLGLPPELLAQQQQLPQQGPMGPVGMPFPTQPQQPGMPAELMPPQQPQAVVPTPAQPEQPAAQPLRNLTAEELNQMIDKPASLQERVDAMEEVGVRGFATVDTFDLLRREAMADTSHLNGLALEDANYVRAAALWTAAMVNRTMNNDLPTKQLPLINEVATIIKNKNEQPDVQEAAVQYLQVLNRPEDKQVKKYLKRALQNKNQRVKDIARDALAGKVITFPNFVENAPESTPGPAQGSAQPTAISQPQDLNDLLASLKPYDTKGFQSPVNGSPAPLTANAMAGPSAMPMGNPMMNPAFVPGLPGASAGFGPAPINFPVGNTVLPVMSPSVPAGFNPAMMLQQPNGQAFSVNA